MLADLHGGDQVVAEVSRQQLGVELEGGGPNLLDPGVTRHTRAVDTCNTRAVHVQYTCSTRAVQVGDRLPVVGEAEVLQLRVQSHRHDLRREVRVSVEWSGSLAFCCNFRGI